MLEEKDVTRGLVGRFVETNAYAYGRATSSSTGRKRIGHPSGSLAGISPMASALCEFARKRFTPPFIASKIIRSGYISTCRNAVAGVGAAAHVNRAAA